MCSPTESNTAAFYVTHFPLWIMIQLDLLVRWAGLLSHHNRTTPEFVFNLAETTSFRRSWDDYLGAGKENEENTPGSETSTSNEPGLTGCSFDNICI